MRDNRDYRAANGRAQTAAADPCSDLRRAENLSPAMGSSPVRGEGGWRRPGGGCFPGVNFAERALRSIPDALPNGLMYVITLRQPWASPIALGVKTVETRSWRAARLIGPTIARHAGKYS